MTAHSIATDYPDIENSLALTHFLNLTYVRQASTHEVQVIFQCLMNLD
jgi:hypothetical protein